MKKKVLLIEDDEVFANAYRNKFLVDGFEAEVALDGEKALEVLKEFRPDAVLLDLVLPKMSGVEVIQKIRAEVDFKDLPVVVFSNTYLTNLMQDAWKAGATKCLSKANCAPRHIVRALRGILERNVATAEHSSDGASPTAAKETAPPSSDQDGEFQTELRQEFVVNWPSTLAQLRSVLQNTVRAEGETTKISQVYQLYRRIHALTGNASIVGMLRMAQMSSALEALLREIHEKPKNINSSTLRTVASAIDFLGILFKEGSSGDSHEYSVLVVDDEAIARRAITYSLEKASMKATCFGDPLQALQQLPQRQFDLIFLDVDMPGMNGFEFCTRLRTLPAYKKTPVVFVTSLNDLESRATSMMSGGNDFIGKPFLFMELAVKALVHAIRGRLEQSASGA